MQIIKEGKLSIEQLKKLVFEYTQHFRNEVLTHPFIGQDCALIDTKQEILAVSTDPITAAKENIGKLAVEVNLNDIAASKAEPFAISVTILCPLGTTEDDISNVMKDIYNTSKANNVQIIGGHTEVTSAVNKIIVSITAFGLLKKNIYDNEIIFEEGDYIYVTKDIAMEGIHILALEKKEELKCILNEEDYITIINYGDNISVLKDAQLARNIKCIMHDITEGGVLGAVWETCELINKGAQLKSGAMPISNTTNKICRFYNINPMKLISSGSMLIICSKKSSKELESLYLNSGIKLTHIGELINENIINLESESTIVQIEPPQSDELYKIIN